MKGLALLWVFGKRMWSISRGIQLDLKAKNNSTVFCIGLSDVNGIFLDLSGVAKGFIWKDDILHYRWSEYVTKRYKVLKFG